MKTKIRSPKIMLVITTFILLVVIGGCFTQLTLPSDASSNCNNSITAVKFNSWFESGTASLNGVVKPANSVTFPDIPNCSFYEWTEQMFLWLTSPSPTRYGGTGLIMDSPAFFDVSPPDADGNRVFIPHSSGRIRSFAVRTAQLGGHDLPVFVDRRTGKLLEIQSPVLSPSGRQVVQNAAGQEIEIASSRFNEKNVPVFLDLSGKEITGAKPIIALRNDTSNVIKRKNLRLTARQDFDRSAIVQKFIINNKPVFLDLNGNVVNVEQNQANGEVLMAQNGSLVYYITMANQVFAYYRTMQGASVPANTKFPVNQAQLDNITNFATANGKTIIDPEALAIEVKSAWVEADGLPDKNKFIQMKAVIPTYDKSNPNKWVPNGQKTATLALVGIHVVGSTKGHPEMLWGTLEHVSNAPNAAYTYNKASGTGNVPQNTSGNWVFCAAGSAGPFNETHMIINGPNIERVGSFTISPSNTLREKPFGMDGTSSSSNAELITINNSVRDKLDNADLRKNYIQTGTTWTIGGASPTGGNQVGTRKLSNITMETYVQGSNCFSCHLSNTTDVSHVFDVLKPLF